MKLRLKTAGVSAAVTIFCAMIACAAAALAQTPPASKSTCSNGCQGAMRTIEVEGHGEARATPDVAFLNLAIETHAVTAQECASLNADLAQQVVKALQGKLDSKGRVWTGGYSLYPEYGDSSDGKKPVIEGYRAENSITVQTPAIDLLGTMIDTAIAAGANRINYLNFDLRDDSKARADAIALASRDAQSQANALAASLGVKLKQIIRASTVAEAQPVPVMRMSAMSAANASTPVESNEVSVPATVTLKYEIE